MDLVTMRSDVAAQGISGARALILSHALELGVVSAAGEVLGKFPYGSHPQVSALAKAYKKAGVSDRLKIDVAKGVGHAVTDEQRKETLDWFVRWLNP